MDGRATLTMDVSSMTTNCEETISTRASHWRRRLVLAPAMGALVVRVVATVGSFGGCGCQLFHGRGPGVSSPRRNGRDWPGTPLPAPGASAGTWLFSTAGWRCQMPVAYSAEQGWRCRGCGGQGHAKAHQDG